MDYSGDCIASAVIGQHRRMKREQGLALMLVLWLLVALSAMLAGIQLLIGSSGNQGAWARHETEAELAAQAGISQVVMDMNRPLNQRHWNGNGDQRQIRFDHAQVSLRVQSVKGLVDINAASAAVLHKLASACRLGAGTVTTWLNTRQQSPYLIVSQLRELLNIDIQHFNCLKPHLTVWSGQTQPDMQFTDAFMNRLLEVVPPSKTVRSDPGKVLVIRSVARLADGYQKQLTVTLLLTHASDGARPYRILDWQG